MYGVSVVGVSRMGSLNLKWASGCLALWKVDSSKATLRGSYGNDQFKRKEKGGARCKGGQRSVIVATGPAIDHAPAISQEPLTKDHLIHYMASGCKPKQNWRSVLHFLSSFNTVYNLHT